MDLALLFGVLLILLPLVTIQKIKDETTFQKIVHIGCLVIGVVLLAGQSNTFKQFIPLLLVYDQVTKGFHECALEDCRGCPPEGVENREGAGSHKKKALPPSTHNGDRPLRSLFFISCGH